jgi:UDP-N-acetylglucosamine enolpyruvyl transferase
VHFAEEESRYVVRGGPRLAGHVEVSGAKNSALKLMAASLLAPGLSVLHNVPAIQDVRTMREVLEHLGAVEWRPTWPRTSSCSA